MTGVQTCALPISYTTGVGSTWLISMQHYLPANSCNGNNGGFAQWIRGGVVDMCFGGHIHMTQVLSAPRCVGSQTGSGCVGAMMPVVDVSGYTYLNDDPMVECNAPTWATANGYSTAYSGVDLSASCPGCTRSVLNSWNKDNTLTGPRFRSYAKIVLTAHSLTGSIIDGTGATVCDALAPTQCATWSLSK